MPNFTAEETLKDDNIVFNGSNMSTSLFPEFVDEPKPVFNHGIPQFKWTKEDKQIYQQNLQNAIDWLLRQYEKKGVMVKSIQLVNLPPVSKNSRPYTRIDFY